MELFTLTRETVYNPTLGHDVIRFQKKDVIEGYESLIWTDRYYGDGDVTIVLPFDMMWLEKLPKGIFLGLDKSNELMVLETVSVEDMKLQFRGISLLKWFNARFVRTLKSHKAQSFIADPMTPGELLWILLMGETQYSSPWLDCTQTDIYDGFLANLVIPEIGLHSVDTSGPSLRVPVSFGPLYDEMKKIAEAFGIGMQLLLETNLDPDAEKPLGFRSYQGLNKTFTQDPDTAWNPIVRFSKDLDSLDNVAELHSLSTYKTIAFAFATNIDADLGEAGVNCAGTAYVVGYGEGGGDEVSGFNTRAIQVFDSDLSGFPEPLSHNDIITLMTRLNLTARKALVDNPLIAAVDGEIVSTRMFKYGRDYFLGDLVELQGSTGATSIARVTEYIRVQDAQGERGYPTVSLIMPEDSYEMPDPDTLAPPAKTGHDQAGDALEVEGDQGSLKDSNIDCTTDGVGLIEGGGNLDWLVHEYSDSYDTDNWHTQWFKWAVPTDRWVTDQSVFSAMLTDYDVHMALILLTPMVGAIPGPGDPPALEQVDNVYVMCTDTTGLARQKPYRMLACTVFGNFWDPPDINENWIYIGVATPPIGKYGNKEENHGGRFTLHWYFTP